MCFGYCNVTIIRLRTGQIEGNYFPFKCFVHPDGVYCEVAETCGCNLQLLHYSCTITLNIPSLDIVIQLSSVYPSATVIQNPKSRSTRACGGDVG